MPSAPLTHIQNIYEQLCHFCSLKRQNQSSHFKNRKMKYQGSLHFLTSVLVNDFGSSVLVTEVTQPVNPTEPFSSQANEAVWLGLERHLVFTVRQLHVLHIVSSITQTFSIGYYASPITLSPGHSKIGKTVLEFKC